MKTLKMLQKTVIFGAFLPFIAFANPANPSGYIARGEKGGAHHEGKNHEGHHEHEEGHHDGEHHHEEGEHHHEEGEHHEYNNIHNYHTEGNFQGGGVNINGGGQENPVIIPNPNPVYVVPPPGN